MPGRLRTNFRSGNLAEDLGLLLLKSIAAVADVPRTEDVGLDAIATLLRRDADGNCYAEDSFGVQLKAVSETLLEYRDHELKWFLGQTQPFFIGRISLADARISLYPTFSIHHGVKAMHATRAIIHFGSSALPPMLGDHTTARWCGHGADERGIVDVWLGEPLLEWTLAQLGDKSFLDSAYRTLKRFLEIARRELHLLSLNQASSISWKTNDADSIKSAFMMGTGSVSDDLQLVVHQIMPALQRLLMFAMAPADDSRHTVVGPLVSLVAALREMGATVEDEGLFMMGLQILADRKSPKAATNNAPLPPGSM